LPGRVHAAAGRGPGPHGRGPVHRSAERGERADRVFQYLERGRARQAVVRGRLRRRHVPPDRKRRRHPGALRHLAWLPLAHQPGLRPGGRDRLGGEVGYDFARLGVPGLTASFWYAQGTGADNTSTGGPAPNRREYDFDVIYTLARGPLRGLQFRVRTALGEQQGTPGLLPAIRLILSLPLWLL